jgi:phosphoserine phosphatase
MPYGVRIRPAMVKLVDYFNQQGASLWIVSASPQKVCEVIADKFRINSKQVMGICETDKGENGWRFPWGSKKLEILLKAGVTHPLFVFGDGMGDVEMLDIAEYPVMIEGNSRKIIELAVKKNWWIFSNTN